MSENNMGWDDVPSQNSNTDYRDAFDIFNLPKDEYVRMRLIGGIVAVRLHWIPVLRKDGKEASYPLLCRKNKNDENCPHCNAQIKSSIRVLTNAILRDLEENKPDKVKVPKNKKFREKGDKWWSSIKIIQVPQSVAQKIKNMKKLNKVKVGGGIKTFPINHDKYGRDITIMYDPTQQGSGMYDIQKEDSSPLTKSQQNYLLFDLTKIYNYIPSEQDMVDSLRKAYNDNLFEDAKDYNQTAIRKVISVGSDDNYNNDDMEEKSVKEMGEKELRKLAKKLGIKKWKTAPKKKLVKMVDDIQEDLESDDGEDLEEMGEKELRKLAKKLGIKKWKTLSEKKLIKAIELAQAEEDDDDDDLDDDIEYDDDLDEEDDDDDDEEDDEDDEDDDDEEDDDDDDDDEEEDDDDDDEEEDDDDEETVESVVEEMSDKEIKKFAKKNKIKLDTDLKKSKLRKAFLKVKGLDLDEDDELTYKAPKKKAGKKGSKSKK